MRYQWSLLLRKRKICNRPLHLLNCCYGIWKSLLKGAKRVQGRKCMFFSDQTLAAEDACWTQPLQFAYIFSFSYVRLLKGSKDAELVKLQVKFQRNIIKQQEQWVFQGLQIFLIFPDSGLWVTVLVLTVFIVKISGAWT